MKKLVALLMGTVLLLLLVACSGAEKKEGRKCLGCGEIIARDASFCGYCGTAVNGRFNAASTDPDSGSNQPTGHIHSYSKTVVEPTCTEQGYTIYICSCGDSYTTDITAPSHHYLPMVVPATCTEQGYTVYFCACRDSYRTDFVEPSHCYVDHVCVNCGLTDPNFTAYQTEYEQLTAWYDAEIAALESNIETSWSNIDAYQQVVDQAQSSLATLSPYCPDWFRQYYINNWREYGDTYLAGVAAQQEWEKNYRTDRERLETIISDYSGHIQDEQTNISMYQSAISSCSTQYSNAIMALKMKYGIS